MQYQLKTRQICLFCIAFLPITKFFIMPSLIAGLCNEDTWISVFINALISFIGVFFITLVCKKSNVDFCTLLENNLGKIASRVILCLYALCFLLKGVLPVIEQKDYVELTLFFTKPSIIYFLPFFFAVFFLSIKRLRTLGRLADIFWTVTILGYLVLFALSIPNIDFETMLPVFANGIFNVSKGSYISLSWFSDSIYFLFFIGQFKFEKNDTLRILLSFAISMLMVVFFAIVFYSTFTTIAFRQHFALTETSKYTTVINNVGRFDYLGIGLLLTSGIISLSLPMFFATHVICRAFNIERKWIVAFVITCLFILPVTIFSEYTYSIQKFITTYSGGLFLLTSFIIPITLPLLKTRGKNNYEMAKE